MTLYKFIFGEAASLRKCMRDSYDRNPIAHNRLDFGGSMHELGLYLALNGWRILHNRINTGAPVAGSRGVTRGQVFHYRTIITESRGVESRVACMLSTIGPSPAPLV